MRKRLSWLLGAAAGCVAGPFVLLWMFREALAKKVFDAAVFATTWLLVSKLFKWWGWL